ncbi:hypothetical protein [Heyndrickxia ginsengihumi]|uniref:hypothetical protein n=1 Tax=Heyndrickxia ginsengihumi TaxID=363870 RepID=UPI001F2269A2|nr:hypothetical protein [Heyndrickxia ginsengihumi]MCM3024548.1 hypothetical protein [Heyndrickxia ginsengihumi]
MSKHRTSNHDNLWMSDSLSTSSSSQNIFRTSSSSSSQQVDEFRTSSSSFHHTDAFDASSNFQLSDLSASNSVQNVESVRNNADNTIYCDPQYVVEDTYVEREVTYVHPVIYINRKHIVNVPRHVYETVTKNIIDDPGIPDECEDCDKHKKDKKRHKNDYE